MRPTTKVFTGLLAGLVLLAAGCAIHDQVQYFAASDPETGETNYYKMTISGWGGFGTDYHMQAGYFSAAAVDILRGSMPKIPVLDLPVEQLEVFDRLTQQFYATLIQEAKRIRPVTDREAMRAATDGRLAFAQKRTRTAESDVRRLEAEIKIVEAGVAQEAASRDAVQKRFDLGVLALTDATRAFENANANCKNKATEVENAQGAVRDAEAALFEAQRERDESEAEPADGEEGDEDPAEPAEGEEGDEDEAEPMDPVATAQAALDLARNRLMEARQELAEAESARDKARAAFPVADAAAAILEKELREAESVWETAARARDRVATRVDAAKNDVLRLGAAAAAAERMLTLLADAEGSASVFGTGDESLPPFEDPEIIRLARLIWLGSLSSSDLASIGMTQNTNPFQFRKLVFWTTAANIDLNQFATEIDAVIGNVTDIALAAKKQAKQQQAQRKARRTNLKALVERLLTAEQSEILNAVIDLNSDAPSTEPGANTPGGTP